MSDQPRPMPATSIRYVGIGEVTLYLVSEDELFRIGKGGPSSTYLNLAIFFGSVAASFFVSLLASPPASIYVFTVIVVVTVISTAAGIVLGLLWRRESKAASNVISEIRARDKQTAGPTVKEGNKQIEAQGGSE